MSKIVIKNNLKKYFDDASEDIAKDILTFINDEWSKTKSVEGQRPAIDTGNLASSIQKEVSHEKNSEDIVIFTDVPYAIHLEFGTKNMGPRPFLRPVLMESYDIIVKRLTS